MLWLQVSRPASPMSEGGSRAVLAGSCPSILLPRHARKRHLHFASSSKDAGIPQNTGR